MTFGAGRVDVREKLHLDLFKSFAAAGLAASAFHVEGERRRRIAAQARKIGAGKETPDAVERFHIGGGIRARRGSDRRLIDQHNLRNSVGALYLGAVDDIRQ